jgi:signal transduction histidine kinase/CheY-like chemotaxis protein
VLNDTNTTNSAGGVDFSITPLTLAFRTPEIETRFLKSYFDNNLQVWRVCHLIAILFFSVVGMWNALVVTPSSLGAWIGVITIVTLAFLGGLIASYIALDQYARFWRPLFAFYVLLTGTAFTYVSIVSVPQLSVFNFVGIIICLFFCYTFIRLTFIWAVGAGNTVVLLYTIGLGLHVETPLKQYLTTAFYIFGLNLLGMIVCYAQEFMARRDFKLTELLKQAENRAQQINAKLEQMVAERTQDLDQTNQELRVSIQREKELVARLEREEKILQKSLAALEQAETIAKLGYFEVDWQTKRGYASKGLSQLLGGTGELAGLTYDGFIERIHPQDKERISALVQEAVREHHAIDCEFRLVGRNDGEIQIQGFADNTYDEKDAPLKLRGVLQDITDRKKAKMALKEMQGQLIQAQKMESVGRLAGGVAHDYNNISGIIIGYAELCLDRTQSGTDLHKYLQEILSAAQRAADITRQLLAFARRQTVSPKVIDLNKTVAGMLKILRRLIGENIDLAWRPGSDTWPVKVDPTQIDQILANLCVNARDAITDVGKVTIETRNVTLDADYCATHAGFVPGQFAMLSISDDGQGMAPEILGKVFEPFFTTKGVGMGTGLGLATVYGIVKQNDGCINIHSEPGRGTRVRIYLPRHLGLVAGTDASIGASVPMGQRETVLLVEDDAAILKLGQKLLTQLGYAVLVANTPHEAIEKSRTAKGEIHLLITDVVMPEMNGRELAIKLLTHYADLKVLFMSGYTDNVIAHHGVLEEGINFLPKPFSKRQLAVAVKQVLGEIG